MTEKMSYIKQRATKRSNLDVDHVYHFSRISCKIWTEIKTSILFLEPCILLYINIVCVLLFRLAELCRLAHDAARSYIRVRQLHPSRHGAAEM